MRIAVFDTHRYDEEALQAANADCGHELVFFPQRLDRESAALAEGSGAVCSFVNDQLDAPALEALHALGVRLVTLRSAGFNHVDLVCAARLGLTVARVPEYSPHAIAEHAVALILALNRKTHRAFNRVREGNFSLEGLVGFDLRGKTVGVLGTGRIGGVLAGILRGFECEVVAHDLKPDDALAARTGLRYVGLDELYRAADIVSIHLPLTPATRHFVGAEALASMKRGVFVINTGRGAVLDTAALIAALKSGQVGAAGLDVYEHEQAVFFRDLSGEGLQDDLLARLLSFPNVMVTSHQGFLTREALANIAQTTLANVRAFERGEAQPNLVAAP